MKSPKPLIVITLALGLLTLNSCKKDKQEAVIYFTASINGTATTFNTDAAAIVSTYEGNTLTTLKGTAKDGSILTISILGTPIAGKTYSDAEANDDDRPLMLITPPGDADSFLNYDDDLSNLPGVTINAVSSTTVSGTFKGTLAGGVTIGGENNFPKKVITDGKFSLNIVK